MSTRAVSVRRRRKVMALIAGGTALGVAGLVTLAAWNDNEWVYGGAGPGGGDDGVGTSEFEVIQRVWGGSTVPTTTTDFGDFESNPGDKLIFDVDPSALTPGDTIYAPVALTTTTGSIAGTVQLMKPVPSTRAEHVVSTNDAGGLLWNELEYSVRVTDSSTVAANCTPDDFDDAGGLVANGLTFDDAVPAGAQPLLAATGNYQYYCFAITLPDDEDNRLSNTLQNRAVYPAWQFAAKSN